MDELTRYREALEPIAAYGKHLYDLYDEASELRRCQERARRALNWCGWCGKDKATHTCEFSKPTEPDCNTGPQKPDVGTDG